MTFYILDVCNRRLYPRSALSSKTIVVTVANGSAGAGYIYADRAVATAIKLMRDAGQFAEAALSS